MSNIFNRTIIAPALAALVAFTAGYAIADEAPPVPKRLQLQSQAPAQGAQASNPCGTATQAAHQEGMRHGNRDMHGKMMEDHQMGSGGTQAMPMGPGGSGGMQMGPGGMPMGPGCMEPDCSGKPGCSGGMPKGSTGRSGSMAPSPSSSPMPMGHM